MLWCNDLVKFVIDKLLELGVQTYFYSYDKDNNSCTFNTSNNVDIDKIIILREEVATYLHNNGVHFELKISKLDKELNIKIKERCVYSG